MTQKQFNIRLDEDLIKLLKDEAQKKGLEQKDLFKEALNQFLRSSKAQIEPTLREIINAYENCHCSQCNSKIPKGQRILWGKDEQGKTIYLCTECELNSETDKTIVKRILKRRSLEREITALQNQLDLLTENYEDLKHEENLQKIRDLLIEQHKFFIEFQKGMALWGNTQLEEHLNKMLDKLREILTYTKDFQTFYEEYIKTISIRKQKVFTE